MPVVRITTNFRIDRDKHTLVHDFHQVLRDILKISEHDRLFIVHEKPDHFFQPLNTEGKYVFVEIQLFPGRRADTKRLLYQQMVAVFQSYGIPAGNIRIVLHEITRENWGIRGGQAASDVDLGYSIHI